MIPDTSEISTTDLLAVQDLIEFSCQSHHHVIALGPTRTKLLMELSLKIDRIIVEQARTGRLESAMSQAAVELASEQVQRAVGRLQVEQERLLGLRRPMGRQDGRQDGKRSEDKKAK